MAAPVLGSLVQVAMSVSDVDRTERFYEEALGLKKIARLHDRMLFFDCGATNLLLEKVQDGANVAPASILYFRCEDIGEATNELKRRGVTFSHEPHRVSQQPSYDLWMSFFEDPDGHLLALWHEAPKDYKPV